LTWNKFIQTALLVNVPLASSEYLVVCPDIWKGPSLLYLQLRFINALPIQLPNYPLPDHWRVEKSSIQLDTATTANPLLKIGQTSDK